jgi:hypothetical protein
MNDNEKLKSSDLFDFDNWTYNVLREDVDGNFFQKIFRGKDYKKSRYWISAVRKGPYMEKRNMEILCYYCLYDGKKRFQFRHPSRIYEYVKYWNNLQEPIDIIQHLRFKSDIESLPECLVFSSDDI